MELRKNLLLFMQIFMFPETFGELSDDFVYVKDINPKIFSHLRYFTDENFIGRQLIGYEANVIILKRDAAEALSYAQADFEKDNYTIIVYDAYRPQMTVDYFVNWTLDLNDTVHKAAYYPYIEKNVLIPDYIASKSGHTMGYTLDMTIAKIGSQILNRGWFPRTLKNGEQIYFLSDGTVDMGSSFDFFGTASHHNSSVIDQPYIEFRNYLAKIMIKNGFEPYSDEWWHYTLKSAPEDGPFYNFTISEPPQTSSLTISIPFLNANELTRCCRGGTKHFQDTHSCMALRSEGSSITCSRTASICCLRSYLDHSCQSGVEIAQQENFCSINVNELGGGHKKECCDCCLLAKELLANGESCVAPKGFSAACLASFNRCCKKEGIVKSPLLITNLPTLPKNTNLEDRCSQAKCEHSCTDRGGETIECSCKPGYDLGPDGYTCVDVDECLSLMFNCLESQRCLNTPGSYKCIRTLSCGTGYALDSETEQCTDVDECNLGSHDCGILYQCRNIQGSYRCDPKRCTPTEIMNPTTGECTSVDCPVGYYPKEGKCEDVDECLIPNKCSQYEECINSPGSYRCQEKGNLCSPGYKIDKETGFCADINECAEKLHNCGSLQCINIPGSYRCRCSAGFEFNEETMRCEDVDECNKFSGHMCSSHAICENTIGSFLCHCKPGFMLSIDGRNCEDINECENGVAKCQQKCINTPGSYQCLCHRGYQLSVDESTCEDIDECAIYTRSGTEICMGECENTPGSYKCRCPLGYETMTDGITCKDVDECMNGINACSSSDEMCINTLGSHKCQKIICPFNYIFDRLHKNRCIRKPSLCDHLSPNKCKEFPVHITWQHIAIPKQVNISAHRTYVTLFSMKGPNNPNTVMQFELRMVKAIPESPNVISAVRSNFLLQKGDNPNSALISLRDSLDGPQEVQLELTLRMTTNGLFTGKYIANLIIYVSQHKPQPMHKHGKHHKRSHRDRIYHNYVV